MEVKIKVQVAPYNAKEALRGGRSLTLPKLNFGFRWVVSTKVCPLYRREGHVVSILAEAGWVSEPVWMFRIILPLLNFELRTLNITCIELFFSDILMTLPVAQFIYRELQVEYRKRILKDVQGAILLNLTYYFDICLEVLTITTKYLNQDSRT